MYGVYFPPTPNGPNRGKRNGGCILTVQGFMDVGDEPQAYVGVTDSIDVALEKIAQAKKEGTFVHFEQNDHTVWSGSLLHINPDKIVSVN